MRARPLAGLALAAGCGASGPSPEEVARGWGDATNHDLDDDAAFFAPGAAVAQGDEAFALPGTTDTVIFTIRGGRIAAWEFVPDGSDA